MIKITKNIYDNIIKLDEFSDKEKFYLMIILKELGMTALYMKRKNPRTHGYVNKRRGYFQEVTGNWKGSDLLQRAEQEGLITINHSYLEDEFTKSYRPNILPDLAEGWIEIDPADYLEGREIIGYRRRLRKKEEENARINWHKKNLSKVRFNVRELKRVFVEECNIVLKSKTLRDIEKEIRGLKREKLSVSQTFLVMKTLDVLDVKGHRIVKGTRGQRHYHTLSNCPKKLRDCLESTNTQKPVLMEIDVKNSQLVCLAILIQNKGLKVEREIIDVIEQGVFYEYVSHALGHDSHAIKNDAEKRNSFKSLFFAKVLFATNRNNETFCSLAKRYPLFCSAIERLSEKENLAGLLQKIESKIILPVVKKFHGIGIHDSIILDTVEESDKIDKVVTALEKRYRDATKRGLGIVPAVHVREISDLRKNGVK